MNGFVIAQFVFIGIQLVLMGIMIYKINNDTLTDEWRKAITTGSWTCCGIVCALWLISLLV